MRKDNLNNIYYESTLLIDWLIILVNLNFQMQSIYKHLWIFPNEQISPEGNLQTVLVTM